jgi:hypothetical protein
VGHPRKQTSRHFFLTLSSLVTKCYTRHEMNSFRPVKCLYCHKPLVQLPKGRTRRYDSDVCRQAASRERALKRSGRRTRSTSLATIVPWTLEEANRFVKQFHRHHGVVIGARFCLAIADRSGTIRGVAIVGRPSARNLDDGMTLEITRVATDGYKNACSMLYGSAWKAAKAIGYRRLVTYTLITENGASLKALGWRHVSNRSGKSWNRGKRAGKRNDTQTTYIKKTRWEISVETQPPFTTLLFPTLP